MSDLGDDGTVLLSAYLRSGARGWLSLHCRCGRTRPVGFAAAAAAAPGASIGQFAARLRCRDCGRRGLGFVICADTRPPAQWDTPHPDSQAGLE